MGQFPWNSQQPPMFSRRRLKSTRAHHQTASGLCFEGAPCRTGPRGHRGVTMVWKWRICKVCSTFSGKMMINHGIARGTGATCPDKPTLAMHRGGRPIFDVLWVWQLVCRASLASVRRQISALALRLIWKAPTWRLRFADPYSSRQGPFAARNRDRFVSLSCFVSELCYLQHFVGSRKLFASFSHWSCMKLP
jgi:hypothetical protein